MANFVISSVTQVSIQCYIDQLDSSYSRSDRTIYWYINGILVDATQLAAYVSNSSPYTYLGTTAGDYSGLTPGMGYYLQTVINYTDGWGQPQSVAVPQNPVYQTTSPPPRPAGYWWTYSKTSGAAGILTAAEWNGLLDNINAVRSYRGYIDYSFTRAVQGNTFTAAMYNQAVDAIQTMGYGGNLATVSQGSLLYAYQLNDLITAINNVP